VIRSGFSPHFEAHFIASCFGFSSFAAISGAILLAVLDGSPGWAIIMPREMGQL
jgi:hypothetical protein